MLSILHVVGAMNRAGVETWLMQVLRRTDRQHFHMDFLVHVDQACSYDDEIRRLGSKVIVCRSPKRPATYSRNFKSVLDEHGPYDIVHSHLHHFTGWVLLLARRSGVPVRVAHSHLDTTLLDGRAGLMRRAYLLLTRHWIRRYATAGLAASRASAQALFGSSWMREPRWRVLHCAIALEPFQQPVDRLALRAQLGIPADAFVVGHVGRFQEQKNHAFLLDIAVEIARREPRMRLVLVGEGPLRPVMEQRARDLAISDRVVFLGSRADVPRLMSGVMDVFVFPSRYEGLGLVLVEAQAAGLPCVLSDAVPPEADLVAPLLRRMALDRSAAAWAAAVVDARHPALSPREAWEIVARSEFQIDRGVSELMRFYEEVSNPGLGKASTRNDPLAVGR